MPQIPRPEDVFVGTKLRELRSITGHTQTSLGNAVGISFQQVQKYETGANRISVSRLVEFARVLDVPPSYFFAGIAGDKEAAEPSSPDEILLLAHFRATGPHAQQSILRIAQETAQARA
tara:strand:+ start:982 stop:1338 length:357 start_codon:yes stop_codon:yes gene_type:complete